MPGMVMHVFNPNTQEAGREILVSELHSDTLFKKKKKKTQLSPSFKKSESLFLFFLFNFIFSSQEYSQLLLLNRQCSIHFHRQHLPVKAPLHSLKLHKFCLKCQQEHR